MWIEKIRRDFSYFGQFYCLCDVAFLRWKDTKLPGARLPDQSKGKSKQWKICTCLNILQGKVSGISGRPETPLQPHQNWAPDPKGYHCVWKTKAFPNLLFFISTLSPKLFFLHSLCRFKLNTFRIPEIIRRVNIVSIWPRIRNTKL